MAVFLGCFFEWLGIGDEYFSWWYVQLMLPYGTGISFYASIYVSFAIVLVHSFF